MCVAFLFAVTNTSPRAIPALHTAFDRYNKFPRILDTSTPHSHRPLSKTRLASCSGGILAGCAGECWRAAPARCWPDTRQDPPARDAQRDTRRDPLAGCSVWWDSRRDPLASCSGGIHWRATLGYSAGYWAGSTGGWDARRDPLASRSGGILGGIHWRAALAGYSAGSTGEQLWRDTGWGRGVEASQTRIPT